MVLLMKFLLTKNVHAIALLPRHMYGDLHASDNLALPGIIQKNTYIAVVKLDFHDNSSTEVTLNAI